MKRSWLLRVLQKHPWLLIVLLVGLPGTAKAADGTAANGFLVALDAVFAYLVAVLSQVLFFSIGGIPFIVLWLIIGAIFFTLRMGFVNIRAFGHAISVVRGHYDNPTETGEVTHFQALAAALSATVGLGNIAGVAIAIQLGGPGAMFWMTMAGLLGMSSKFVECTLGLKYRIVKPDGSISGGPMHFLSRGLGELGLRPLGKLLAGVFAVFCIGGAFGGGNMFQANQSYATVAEVLPFFQGRSWLYGLILGTLVALVIIGGIRRIGAVAEKLVPTMCLIYVVASMWIILSNFTQIPAAFAAILTGAFAPQAVAGGFIGVLVQGFRRAAFSNEAGVGSAAIAHSAARTEEPIREGIVALLEPFIDTVIVCNMTALVVIITGVYTNKTGDGAQLTNAAFGSAIDWFPIVLSLAVFLFAFSTMISWSYYGERSWAYLFGDRTTMIYKVLFVIFVFIGSVVRLSAVMDFSDMMILSMAFPNILGCYLLSHKVAADLRDYMKRLQTGQMPVYK